MLILEFKDGATIGRPLPEWVQAQQSFETVDQARTYAVDASKCSGAFTEWRVVRGGGPVARFSTLDGSFLANH